METDRRLMPEEPMHTDIPYTTSGLSPYSTTSTYSGDSSHNDSFYGEFDWHHQNMDPSRMYYPVQERADLSMHTMYPAYTAPSTDVYQPNAVWHHQLPEVSTQSSIPPVTSILPAVNFNTRTSPTSGTMMGPNGKAKRKRIQTQPQRKAANVRERKRMFHLNEAFDDLRLRLPAFNYEKRLSRIETLRLAMTYIGFMKEVTDGKDPKDIKLADIADLTDFTMSKSSSNETSTDTE